MPNTKNNEPRPDKVQEVAEIREILQASTTIILTDYQGQDVKSLFGMRRKLREAGSGYRVMKNNLFVLAAKDLPAELLVDGLFGPTAMVYTGEDPVATAKTLQDFTKGAKGIKLKSGVVDGRMFDEEQLASLATMPSKQQLYAMVVGGLQGPITGLVSTCSQMISQLVFTLQGVADQKAA